MKNFEICLSNRDGIFDSATFDDAKAAAEWATGRSGQTDGHNPDGRT